MPAPAVLRLTVEREEGAAASATGTRATGPDSRGHRFGELDSLRGIAAATVVACHLVTTALAAYGRPGQLWVLEYTPLRIFWAGHQAVVFLLGSPSAGRVLRLAPLRWLGSVSYSLYLFHAIVLLTLLKLLLGVIPPWSIWMLAVVMALALSAAAHRLLELPSIALGRRLAGLVSGGRPARAPRPSVLRDPRL